jgi:hypothetical protein
VTPQRILGCPQVGRLTSEGGAVDLTQGWEEVRVVAREETVEASISVDPKELADHLDGEHLASESFGAGPRWRSRLQSLSQSSVKQKTETMKVLRIHGWRSPLRRFGLGTTERSGGLDLTQEI